MAETDLDYVFDSSVTSQDTFIGDVDKDNLPILIEQLADINKQLELYGSWDVIDEKDTLSVNEQTRAYKRFVTLLTKYKGDLEHKVERLKNNGR